MFVRWAEITYARRKVFLVVLLCAFATIPILAASKVPVADEIIPLVVFPVSSIAWGVYLMCVWFHPNSGVYRPNVRSSGGRKWLSSLWRVYLTWFLVSWFVFGILAGPIFFLLRTE